MTTATTMPFHTPALPGHIFYRAGVDGGGSGTRVRLCLRDGTVIGEGSAGPSGLVQGCGQAWEHIEQALHQAVQQAIRLDRLRGLPPPDRQNCALGVGLAGYNNAAWAAQFLAINPGYDTLTADTDAFTALLGAHRGQPGGLVIVGTGSVALALHADGQRRAAGGWGFPSGDEGGGAILGLQAVNMAQRAADGRRTHSPLTLAILAATGGTPDALLGWCCAASQADFGSLAPLVFEHETQDVDAAHLLYQALATIVQLASAIDPDNRLPLVLRGSIGMRLLPRLPLQLQERIAESQGDALEGALQLVSAGTP